MRAVADYEAERVLNAISLRQKRIENEALLEEKLRLDSIIAKGHFRSPETGRIGPVGKVYE